MEDARARRGLVVAIAILPLVVAAALWLPRGRQLREDRGTGIASPIAPGTLAEARRQLDPGTTAAEVAARLGRPSMSVATEARDSRRETWTYHFSDGTMLIHITDGRVQRVSTTFGAPKVPTSSRPE